MLRYAGFCEEKERSDYGQLFSSIQRHHASAPVDILPLGLDQVVDAVESEIGRRAISGLEGVFITYAI
jgi:hypothetical protein